MSVITDRADIHKYVIDWEEAKMADRQTDWCAPWFTEVIWIRKIAPTMNIDEGSYRLSHVWDSLLATAFLREVKIQFLLVAEPSM